MADRYEVTFIRAWRIVNTMAQVMVEEHFKLFFVARCCIIKVLNWFISEEDCEHGAYPLYYNRHIVLCCQAFKAFAKAVGISNAALSNYETGYREPDLDTLCALSRYYGLTLDELLDVNGEQHEPIYDLSP